jgi:hypothetical protein
VPESRRSTRLYIDIDEATSPHHVAKAFLRRLQSCAGVAV